MTPSGVARRWVAALALPIVLGLGVPAVATAPPASATSNGSFSISPYRAPGSTGPGRSLFDISLKAGQEVRDAFTLANDSPHAQAFNIYPADAYDVTAGGGFALRGYGEKNDGVGSWVELPKSVSGTYRLAADAQVTVPFTVSVPADASPGDHAGGIVALAVGPSSATRSRVHFSVRQGVGVRVYLHVLGPVQPALAVENLTTDVSVPPGAFVNGSSKAAVTFDVVNSGNTIYPSVLVRAYATNVFGDRVQSYRPVRLATVLPGSRETVTEPEWSPLPLAGPVTVHVQLVATRVKHNYTSTFWVVPWLLVVLVVLVVLALAAFVVLLRRRRRSPPRHAKGRTTGQSARRTDDATTPGTQPIQDLQEE